MLNLLYLAIIVLENKEKDKKLDIQALETQYEQVSATTRDLGKGIAKSVSMLQLDGVQETIANAVIQIESVTNKSTSSKYAKVPFIGKFLASATEEVKNQELKTGEMVVVVERLFAALEGKKKNIVAVADTLFDLKEKLINEVSGLVEQETVVQEFLETGENSSDTFKAKNLLVQIQPTIIQSKDRIQIIDATIRSAEVCSMKISSMLPALEGNLITEMSIQAGLQELRDFKGVFDATVEVVEQLSHDNNKTMNSVLLDVVDLAVANPSSKQLMRLENSNAERAKLSSDIKTKLAKAVETREKAMVTLANTRESQAENLLSFKEV